MSHHRKAVVVAAAIVALAPARVDAVVLGTATVTNAVHYGYDRIASTSANNTKATIGPFSGTARVINVSGTVTKVNSEAWISSIRVQPKGGGLATGAQPWIQFSEKQDFEGTVNVSAQVYIPGGFSLSSPLSLEMFSIDAEQYVPGVDATSTLTYSFESDFAPGTASYSGRIEPGDSTFARPRQNRVYFGNGDVGFGSPYSSGYTPYYDVQAFHVDTPGRYSMVASGEFEMASVLYRNAFDPTSPLTNVLRAFEEEANVLRSASFNNLPAGFNDDATGGTRIDYDLLPGVQYYYVTTARALPGQLTGGPFVGRYSNVITGAGTVALGTVPEPTSLGAMALALGALITRRRR